MAHRPPLNDIKGDLGDPQSVRLYRIVIENDDLVLSHTSRANNVTGLAADYTAALGSVTSAVPNATIDPAYYLIRTAASEWLFITYVPDGVHPKLKMRYAYSENALKKDMLARFNFSDSMFANTWDELTYSGYQAHLAAQKVSALSVEEKERAALDTASAAMVTSAPVGLPGIMTGGRTGSVGSLLSGSPKSGSGLLAFPMDDAVKAEIQDKVHVGGHVVLTVAKETITHCVTVAPTDKLADKLPTDLPTFIVSRLNESLLAMTFCCPESTRVKDRMIASSARASVLAYLESLATLSDANAETEVRPAGKQLAKRFEVSDIEDILSLEEMRVECGLNSDGSPVAGAGARSESPGAAGSSPSPTASVASSNQSAVPAFKRPRPPGRPRAGGA
ncbi:hypothetical protein BCR44DRAFT_54918 [Catenaria anguillulae PL171]|uniref:ADF-H domain-containing protein n=1 Tax=Catenaria anguillulae PL171 TaxID=765915 RepID=A0A1Y2HCG8_9FUNG|nr:hypothetical protein BCR44DRAFT_54918 [Catenaria anguillulae PL171]